MESHDLILVIGIFAFGLLELAAIVAERKRTEWRRGRRLVTPKELRSRIHDSAREA